MLLLVNHANPDWSGVFISVAIVAVIAVFFVRILRKPSGARESFVIDELIRAESSPGELIEMPPVRSKRVVHGL